MQGFASCQDAKSLPKMQNDQAQKLATGQGSMQMQGFASFQDGTKQNPFLGGLKCKSSEFGLKNQNLMMGGLKHASLSSTLSTSNNFKRKQGQETEKNFLGIDELQSSSPKFSTTANPHGK